MSQSLYGFIQCHDETLLVQDSDEWIDMMKADQVEEAWENSGLGYTSVMV